MSENTGLTETEIASWWQHVEAYCDNCKWSRHDVSMCPQVNERCVFYGLRMVPLMLSRGRIKITDYLLPEPVVDATPKKSAKIPRIR